MGYHADGSITHNGARYFFRWTCGFAGETEFEIHEPSGATFKAELQHSISDYWRDNWTGIALAERESRLGLLVRSVCDNAGEISAETLDAFNAWRLREYELQMAEMESRPERYGDSATLRAEFPAPAPVSAGRWTKGSGWTRVMPAALAA